MLTHTYYLSFTKYAQPIGWKVFSIGFWKSYFRMISEKFDSLWYLEKNIQNW